MKLRFLSLNKPQRSPKQSHFAFGNFSLLLLGHALVLLTVIYSTFPSQLTTSWMALLLVFTVAVLINSLFEYLFHRYLLHNVPVGLLTYMADSHRLHHRLTKVIFKQRGAVPGYLMDNHYPIVSEDQHESSTFPLYGLVIFMIVFSPAIFLCQLLFPALPVLFGGYNAVIFSYGLYEVKHAIEHLDYKSFWQPKINNRWLGWLFKRWYSFHFIHHVSHRWNQAIGGFFGFPLWDWLFGTYYAPVNLPQGPYIDKLNLPSAPPRRIISWLDSWVKNQSRAYRRQTKDDGFKSKT